MTATASRRSSALKPGYDIPAGQPRPLPPGVSLIDARAAMVRRLHDAVLTASVMRGDGPADRMTFWPDFPREFSDRVGEDEVEAPKQRWRPTPAQVDDMDAALTLLNGLREDYYGVVFLKALFEFRGRSTWEAIGDRFGRDGRWARETYERAMIQAARADGMLATVAGDYAVIGISAMTGEGMFSTYVAAVAKPRQTLADVKAKSPIPLVDAFVLWVSGKTAAQRLVDEFRAVHVQRRRGSWFAINPFEAETDIAERARAAALDWRLEYIELPGERVANDG